VISVPKGIWIDLK